ncbi:pyridoxamine 5'-phosphate oxidase [Epidermidibacterium keratini]|uniref:Pyridoxine/pyridoxamine 5'-phosphate oxidase n=1 Tax=Epidermidibacterium keratini TaxID=1891644 RepID=A0A7L4YQH3_9ACTN|nr:pyridoxamine 5'-phosphate oxidase [Epidermidibacterium keratini]QHC01154.1 pyridoxamine 5'-phosphate oxidase [Epidermidibacterium keratini]
MNDPRFDVRNARVRYELERLDETTLLADPIAQFGAWLGEAAGAGVPEPNAMVLATADAAGAPRARTVLLRGYDDGFVFFTNYDSRKGADISANPHASVCFPWVSIHRQVIIEGTVERVSAAESSAYFASRPLESQAASAISPQSQVISSLAPLIEQMDAAQREHPEGITRPEHWGGYRLTPTVVEFWQGNVGRLHDRFRYRQSAEGWACERLAP